MIRQPKTIEFKVIFIGDSGVGKTSIIMRGTQGIFFNESDIPVTIGFSFQKILRPIKDNTNISLYIWDTAGQEMYRSMIKMYYRGVHCAVITYDITERQSFENVDNWFNDLREKQTNKLPTNPNRMDLSVSGDCLYFVVASKCDKQEERKVSTKEGIKLVNNYKEQYKIDISYIEVSAKSDINVQLLFDQITQKI